MALSITHCMALCITHCMALYITHCMALCITHCMALSITHCMPLCITHCIAWHGTLRVQIIALIIFSFFFFIKSTVLCYVSHVTCQWSHIACHLSPVTCQEPQQQATAIDPPPVNSPSMHSMILLLILIDTSTMIWGGPKINFFLHVNFQQYLSKKTQFLRLTPFHCFFLTLGIILKLIDCYTGVIRYSTKFRM